MTSLSLGGFNDICYIPFQTRDTKMTLHEVSTNSSAQTPTIYMDLISYEGCILYLKGSPLFREFRFWTFIFFLNNVNLSW